MRASFVLFLSVWSACVALGAGVEHREYGAWCSSVLGGGGYLQSISICESDADWLYMATDVGGVYGSRDGGETWHMLHGGLPLGEGATQVRGVLVHPDEPERVLVAVGNRWDKHGVYASEDGGESFQKVLSGEFEGNGATRAHGLVLISGGGDRVVACPIGSGPQVSEDFGQTWQSLGLEGVYPQDFVVDREDDSRMWLNGAEVKGAKVKRAGLFLTEDAGETWECVRSVDFPKEMVQDPVDATLLHGVFSKAPQVRFSRDAGRTWQAYANAEIFPSVGRGAREDGTYSALACGPDFVLLGGHGGTFYRLACGSARWERLAPPRIEDEGWYAGHAERVERHFGAALGFVAVSPRDPQTWYFTDWYACYRSDDAGASWKLAIDGIEMSVVHCLAQDPSDPDCVHVGLADIGYFRSEDGGESFAKDSWGRHRGISNNIKCISVCIDSPQHLYATGPITWKWAATQTFRSDDAGRTWKRPAQRGLPKFSDESGPRCNTIAVSPTHPDHVYLTVSGIVQEGGGGIYASTNGGDDWEWFGQGLPHEALFRKDIWTTGPELAISRNGTLVAVSHDTGNVFVRAPNADAWSPRSLPGRSSNVVADPFEEGAFYMARRKDGLWTSHDDGATWSRLWNGDASHVAIDMATPQRIAVVSPDSLRLSHDAGRTWSPLSSMPPHRSWRNTLAFAGERLLLGTAGSGVFFVDVGESGP